jgi:hypothetical protein
MTRQKITAASAQQLNWDSDKFVVKTTRFPTSRQTWPAIARSAHPISGQNCRLYYLPPVMQNYRGDHIIVMAGLVPPAGRSGFKIKIGHKKPSAGERPAIHGLIR